MHLSIKLYYLFTEQAVSIQLSPKIISSDVNASYCWPTYAYRRAIAALDVYSSVTKNFPASGAFEELSAIQIFLKIRIYSLYRPITIFYT